MNNIKLVMNQLSELQNMTSNIDVLQQAVNNSGLEKKVTVYLKVFMFYNMIYYDNLQYMQIIPLLFLTPRIHSLYRTCRVTLIIIGGQYVLL